MKSGKFIQLALLAVFLTAGYACVGQSSSVLQSGKWYRLAIKEHGVYKMDFNFLKKIGFDLAKTDPGKIQLYGYGGGMLPQANSASRPADLIQNAIFVEGEADGKFDKNDFILFYAEGPDHAQFNVQAGVYNYQNNLYADKNFYFLTVGEDPGKRISTSVDMPGSFPLINEFDDFVYHEVDEYNELHSGREWFGEKFGLTNELTLNFNVSGIVASSEIKIVSDVMGQSHSSASFKLFLNGISIGEQNILPIADNRYAIKGIHNKQTISVNEASVSAATRTQQEIKYQFVKGSGFSQGYLDFTLLSFKRQLSLYGNQTIFTSAASLANPVSTFAITSPAGANVWDITDPANAKAQAFVNAGTIQFSTSTDQLKKFIVFNSTVSAPEFVGKVENQDLHGLATPNLIIITHPSFKQQAERLAEHRRTFSNLTVHVVEIQQVYNEFSSGRQDVSAIRDFVKYLYNKNPGTLKGLLLFGKCSYDYKDRVPNNTNFVATYESRNSLAPLQSYSSDDYFGFLENNEGEWPEEPAQNHTLDIGVGRLPVRTAAEAGNIVDKLIQYDTRKESLGYWRKEIVFVADDGNSEDQFTSLHQVQADALASYIDSNHPGFDTKKIFMGTYKKTVQPNGESIDQMTDDIVRAFDKGSLIINYTGHGSEKLWADERVFSDVTISELDNKLYPFLVTATCEFGQHDDPREISSAELCVVLKNGGTVGLVATGRPVNSITNFNLNQAFYEALFQREGNNYRSIGQVFRHTKNNSTSGVANRNFSLLGDPSMMLALPKHVVHINSLKTVLGSDTLKALSTVVAKGEIRNSNGDKLTSFSGILEATLFDKETSFTTIGRNNPPYNFKQWHNALFRGKASVKNGEFTLQFMMPKNISYQTGTGKMGFYSGDPASLNDANGSEMDFKIGGTEINVATDNTPPTIEAFMGDATFINGGITTPDTYLIARLKDASGINISSYGIGNSIVAILDNDLEVFVLNDYYSADADTHASGWIRYPLKDLKPGKHTLTVKAWDVFNNPASATVDFVVTDGDDLVIESFYNYPNPFQDNTTISFTHNRSGDDLKAQLFIYKITGEILDNREFIVQQSEYRVNLIDLAAFDWEEKKLSPGLYLARLIVRSLSNGSKNEQVTKLIMLN